MTDDVYGSTLQPFGGITTFMRQPATRALENVDVAILGIPYERDQLSQWDTAWSAQNSRNVGDAVGQ